VTQAGNIDNTQGAAVGSGSQANVQTVTVQLPPDPPRNPNEFAHAAWLLLLSDQGDRRQRQESIDQQFLRIDRQFRTIVVALIILGSGLVLEVAVLFMFVRQ
jgi:hypothetical protein